MPHKPSDRYPHLFVCQDSPLALMLLDRSQPGSCGKIALTPTHMGNQSNQTTISTSSIPSSRDREKEITLRRKGNAIPLILLFPNGNLTSPKAPPHEEPQQHSRSNTKGSVNYLLVWIVQTTSRDKEGPPSYCLGPIANCTRWKKIKRA